MSRGRTLNQNGPLRFRVDPAHSPTVKWASSVRDPFRVHS
jgi:hypothetical protein